MRTYDKLIATIRTRRSVSPLLRACFGRIRQQLLR